MSLSVRSFFLFKAGCILFFPTYRASSYHNNLNKLYLIFHTSNALLIRGQRLFESSVYLKVGCNNDLLQYYYFPYEINRIKVF